jgi:hypothetical protein
MANISSDPEVLKNFSGFEDDGNNAGEQRVVRRARRRAQYQHDQTFDTTEAFDEWWAENSDGWKFTNSNTAVRSRELSKFYL